MLLSNKDRLEVTQLHEIHFKYTVTYPCTFLISAYGHRKGSTKETAAPVADHIDQIFQGAYDRTLQTIQDDPMHDILEAKIAKVCKSNSELAYSINTLITDIFRDTSGNTCKLTFHILHNARIDSKQMVNITETIECNSVPSKYKLFSNLCCLR